MATFSVIATPIGNLEDITLRALRTLAAADLVCAEDTRMARKLMEAHGISRPSLSYHARSGEGRTDEIIEALRSGKKVALVSDAGTPGISDPGAELVARIRTELGGLVASGELVIEAVPGPSALTAALSIAGVPCHEFMFLGFLPHKKGRQTLVREIVSADRTVVFYESPHRIMKALAAIEAAGTELGEKSSRRTVTVCRELTKVFEEVASGTAGEVRAHFEAHPERVRGEFVVIVSR